MLYVIVEISLRPPSFCIFFPLFLPLFIFFHIFTAFDKADFDVEIYRIPFDHDGIHVTLANVQANKIPKKIRISLKVSY